MNIIFKNRKQNNFTLGHSFNEKYWNIFFYSGTVTAATIDRLGKII